MPKVNDIKAYWKEIAAKAGLDEESLKQVSGVIDNDKFAKAFSDNFKPLPDYSHDLDDVRNKTKQEKDAQYQEWYDKEQKKYQEYLAGVNELQWYRQQYPTDGTGKGPGEGRTMTQEDMDRLVEAKIQATMESTLSRRDAAVLDLLEVREFHMTKFKNSLDVKAFESAWKDHPEWGGSLKQAYKSYVEPELEKARESEWNAKLAEKYQEGIRDGFTRKQIPTDHQPKTFSPMFDRKEDVAKLTQNEQDTHSRNAFFEGLREGNKQPV